MDWEQSYQSVNWQSPVNGSHDLNKGLVGWWLVVPHWSGGTVLRDLLNRNHGTLTNMDPATDWSRFGRPSGFGTLDFDGSNDLVSALTPGVTWSLPITIVGSFRPQTVTGAHSVCEVGDWAGSDAAADAHGLLQVGGAVWAISQSSTVNVQAVSGSILSIGEWTWGAAVFRGDADREVFVNGSSAGTNTTSRAVSENEFDRVVIGQRARSALSVQNFNGSIDDARIYNRELTASEIASLYEEYLQGYPSLLNRVPLRYYSPAAAGGAAVGRGLTHSTKLGRRQLVG